MRRHTTRIIADGILEKAEHAADALKAALAEPTEEKGDPDA